MKLSDIRVNSIVKWKPYTGPIRTVMVTSVEDDGYRPGFDGYQVHLVNGKWVPLDPDSPDQPDCLGYLDQIVSIVRR